MAAPESADVPNKPIFDIEAIKEMVRIPPSLIAAADAAEEQRRKAQEAREDTSVWDKLDEVYLHLKPRSSLDKDTLDLIDALAKSKVFDSQSPWVSSDAVRQIAVDELSWPDSTEGSRQIAAAL